MRIFYQSPVSRTWIRQRPQEIAEGLSKCGHQVFWFYAGNFLKTRFRRFDDGNGLCGLELPVLPFASRCRLIEWLNRWWCFWWLRRIQTEVMIATNPVALPWLPHSLRALRTVYDCMDVQTAFFTGRRRRRMAETERELVDSASCIVASSDFIKEKLVASYQVDPRRIEVVPNGITLDAYPVEMSAPQAIHRPSIAYFGTIAPWFDWNGVTAAALAHPEWHFDFFGPSDKPYADLPHNVHLHGPIPHGQVLPQAKASDVLLMPFLRNELIDGVDPVKMYEYLQAGRPIVSSWWPLLGKFKPFAAVQFYGSELSLGDCIERALRGPRQYAVPTEFLESNTWLHRINSFDLILKFP